MASCRPYDIRRYCLRLRLHSLGIHLYVRKASYCEHLDLSVRSIFCWLTRLCDQLSVAPETITQPRPMKWIRAPLSLSIRWNNSRACCPGQQPPETGGLLSIQNVASVMEDMNFQFYFILILLKSKNDTLKLLEDLYIWKNLAT